MEPGTKQCSIRAQPGAAPRIAVRDMRDDAQSALPRCAIRALLCNVVVRDAEGEHASRNVLELRHRDLGQGEHRDLIVGRGAGAAARQSGDPGSGAWRHGRLHGVHQWSDGLANCLCNQCGLVSGSSHV